MLSPIQIATTTVCAIRKVGVPKNRANDSACVPNQSVPKADERCACGAWNRRCRGADWSETGDVMASPRRSFRDRGGRPRLREFGDCLYPLFVRVDLARLCAPPDRSI